VKRAEAAERRPGEVEVQDRVGEFQRDVDADEEAGDAPEHGCDNAGADDIVHVAMGLLAKRYHLRLAVAEDRHRLEAPRHRPERDHRDEAHVEGEERIVCLGRCEKRDDRDRQEHPALHHLHREPPGPAVRRISRVASVPPNWSV
jgi:hypothetical protein